MLFTIFLALTVFGGAVTLVDLLGGLGSHGDNGGGDSSGDDATGLEGHGHETGLVKTDSSHFDGTRNLPDRAPGSRLYTMVSWLRRSVYFSLGAGLAGIGALVSGAGAAGAVVWSLGTGGAALGLLSVFRKFQSEDLDSTVTEEELLYEEGEVTVGIFPGQIGKVRLKGKGSLVERYARSRLETALAVGSRVRVSEVNDDALLVEPVVQEEHQGRTLE